MNSSYLFLLRRRYHYKWKNLKTRIKYYMDFSLIYVILIVGIFGAIYQEMWKDPHYILQGLARVLVHTPENYWYSLGLVLLLQSAYKGLSAPPMLFNRGDTYFLFTLPIPRWQYIATQWLIVLGKYLLIAAVSFILLGPVLHLMWEDWLMEMGKLFLTIMGFILLLSTTQWLTFQLPQRIKGWILRVIGWVKRTILVLMGISALYILYLWIFQRNRMKITMSVPPINSGIFTGPSIDLQLLILIACPVLIVLSWYFITRCPLENIKNSSLEQDRIKGLISIGMAQEARILMKRKGKGAKKYFLSIPGTYRRSKIFLWRNASHFIKHPLRELFPYIIYTGLSMVFIESSQGDAISLVFIFLVLYILGGQLMLTPFKRHYEESYLLQSIPMGSKDILKGYILLPVILSIVGGIIIALFVGWKLGSGGIILILILNLPFFSYYTLMAAMQNVLEDASWAFSPTNTLNNETMLLLRGAAPIVFANLFSSKGIPILYLGIGTMVIYLLIARSAQRDATELLMKVLGKYR